MVGRKGTKVGNVLQKHWNITPESEVEVRAQIPFFEPAVSSVGRLRQILQDPAFHIVV